MIAENTLDSMSKQEKIAWVSLGSTLLIVAYFVEKMFDYHWQIDMYSREMAKIIMNTMLLGIGAEAIYAWIRRQPGLDAVEDERDGQIRAAATIVSYRFLVVMLGAGIGALAFTPNLRPGPLAPVLVAYVLLALLIGAGIVKNVAEIISYRRGM